MKKTRDQVIKELNEIGEYLDVALLLPAIEEASHHERAAEVVAMYEFIRKRRLEAGLNTIAEFDSSFLAGLIRIYKSTER